MPDTDLTAAAALDALAAAELRNRAALRRLADHQAEAQGQAETEMHAEFEAQTAQYATDPVRDAAPELLAALKASLEVMDRYNGHHEVKNHAADIIAKAEARS